MTKLNSVPDIIKHLSLGATPFTKVNQFSDQPGIYALFFYGKQFPLKGYKTKKEEILYIGKTESSQQSRDADTHFASGRTGSSTLRRSFGAMLIEKLNLKPIPRGNADIEKNRTTHFKFDATSEEKLTQWMKMNLGLSFYPYPKPVAEIDHLETLLIQVLAPLLNIDRKNRNNPYAATIKMLRKETGVMAYSTSDASISVKNIKPPQGIKAYKKINAQLSGKIHKYEVIWQELSSIIINSISKDNDMELYIGEKAFEAIGNRKSYAFNLVFDNCNVANNIRGSAVARDLARVLESKKIFQHAARGKLVNLKLNKSFELLITID